MRMPLLAMLLLAGCAASGNRPASAPDPQAKQGLGFLPPQGPPSAGCGLYLYVVGEARLLVLAADSSTGTAQIMVDGAVMTLSLATFDGAPKTGFSPRMRYAVEGNAVDLDLAIDGRTDMTQGAAIESGSMRFDRTGADSVAFPVQGLIACTP